MQKEDLVTLTVGVAATFSKAEHTVINVGDSESPRLVRHNQVAIRERSKGTFLLTSAPDYLRQGLTGL